MIWAVRMPGGRTKIIKSNVMLDEREVKEIYANQNGHKAAKCLVTDRDAAWPLCKVIDEVEMHRSYSQFLQTSERTGNPRGLIEVESKPEGAAKKKKPQQKKVLV